MQVEYIASAKQASLTSSTTFNSLNITASGPITAAHINSDGTVAASTINFGAINAFGLNVSRGGSIATPSLSVSNDITVSGHSCSAYQLTV